MPKCPKCGGEIKLDGVTDKSENLNEFYKDCVGHCLICGTDYQWFDVYDFKFKEIRQLEEY